MLTGGALFYTVGVDTSAAHIYGYSFLTGLGTGMYLQASFSVAQASVSLDMLASASDSYPVLGSLALLSLWLSPAAYFERVAKEYHSLSAQYIIG